MPLRRLRPRDPGRRACGGGDGLTPEPAIGGRYEVTITDEIDTVWTGRLGIGAIGDVRVVVPKASRGDRVTVRVTGIVVDPWTERREARWEPDRG